MTTKERSIQIISQLPDDATVADIMRELYVQMKIEQGLRELDAGKGLEHSQVKKQLAKWLD
jgi:predicted transcriptional regulator